MTSLKSLLRKPPLKVRRYVYRVATAVLGILGAYGVVSDDKTLAWALLLATVTGMADANVPNAPNDGDV